MAVLRRFFLEQNCRNDDLVEIVGNEFYHIKKVLRLTKGEKIVLCFNDGIDCFAVLTEVNEKNAVAQILEEKVNLSENSVDITLFQAAMKGDKMDFCIQKAVELGVNHIVPFENKFTVAKFDDDKTERFERIALEASKQCGRAKLSQVDNSIKFSELLKRMSKFEMVLFCNEHEKEKNFFAEVLRIEPQKDIAVIIGSEGGFSVEEAEKLTDLPNVISLSFGKRILRAETAGVYALAILCGALMNKGKKE